MINAKILRKHLEYCQKTGRFKWLMPRSNKIKPGDSAGVLMNIGYVLIGIFGKRYYAHRLAFLYMTGKMPVNQVDHINLIRHDNRWKNLRHATRSQNHANTVKKRPRKSVYKGVTVNSGYSTLWRAKIKHNGTSIHLGYFSSEVKAAKAYDVAARKIFGEHARTNF